MPNLLLVTKTPLIPVFAYSEEFGVTLRISVFRIDRNPTQTKLTRQAGVGTTNQTIRVPFCSHRSAVSAPSSDRKEQPAGTA